MQICENLTNFHLSSKKKKKRKTNSVYVYNLKYMSVHTSIHRALLLLLLLAFNRVVGHHGLGKSVLKFITFKVKQFAAKLYVLTNRRQFLKKNNSCRTRI